MGTRVGHDDPLGMRLALAMRRLHARLREAMPVGALGLPISQLAIVKRLREDGPATAASLAAAEHVSHQAIAQILAELRRLGLVRATADPTDRRKSVIRVTRAGHRLFETVIASRDAWLAHAIEATIAPGERAALRSAIDLLERLADVERPKPKPAGR